MTARISVHFNQFSAIRKAHFRPRLLDREQPVIARRVPEHLVKRFIVANHVLDPVADLILVHSVLKIDIWIPDLQTHRIAISLS